jgi:hypothetical protein
MADRKISDLTALTTPASGDFLPIVDISEAAAATKNKRITIEELMRGMPDGTAAAPGIAFENDPNTGIYSPGADTLAFVEGGVEAMRIDSSGNVGIGITSPISGLHLNNATAGSAANFTIGNPANLWSIKTGTTDNALVFIDAQFSAERARINNIGNVGIGTSAPGANHALEINGVQKYLAVTANAGGGGTVNPSTSSGLFFSWNRSNGEGESNIIYGTGSGATPGLAIGAWNGTTYNERMRIDSSGDMLLGTTTSLARLTIEKAFAGGTAIDTNTTTASTTYNAAVFRHNSTAVGQIAVSTTATSYITSSDYRLKENVTAVIDGITRLQQLKPSRFNFTANPDHTVDGFIAHEAQAVVPECVTGEKDAVDDDGNPVYQGIDQSKLVPLLTAALQEAIAKIETLEARLTAAGIE